MIVLKQIQISLKYFYFRRTLIQNCFFIEHILCNYYRIWILKFKLRLNIHKSLFQNCFKEILNFVNRFFDN